jgi:hypothetical protein
VGTNKRKTYIACFPLWKWEFVSYGGDFPLLEVEDEGSAYMWIPMGHKF